ncbi:MAG TPA: EAL domain-containing protein, partial [Aminobacteriaceae bacterium]|nr:EAL domain-containing protein [Aminobacteriaceae bacterium]
KKISNALDKAYDMLENDPLRFTMHGQTETADFLRFLALDLENDLQTEKLRLHYQPQVDHDGRVFGVEALLRWTHENYGPVAPQLAVRLAESTGLIGKLGYWILNRACSDLARVRSTGRTDIVFSINVSPIQLEDEHFAQTLLALIEKHAVDPAALKIEITEESALANSARVIEQLKTLVQHGVRLAMDDFGMGHTSLKYMREYSFDTIKIDGSIVREVTGDKKCADIIASIVSLGAAMSFSVVAEFVENEEQMKALQTLGCLQYQGYLFGKPVPFEEMFAAVQKEPARFGELP